MESLDQKSFLKLLSFQVQEGVTQFVLASTTGESPTLEDKDIEKLCNWLRSFEKENQLDLKLLLAHRLLFYKISYRKNKKSHRLRR